MKRVLIVDDNASFRQLAVRLLTRAGFDVVGEADDAASASTLAARLQPDAILMDVILPDGSGLDVAHELTAAGAAMQIVLTSSRDRSDFGDDASLPDGCVFVPKHELNAAVMSAAFEGRA